MTLSEKLLEAVRAMPGSTLQELVTLVDGANSTVSARLSELFKHGAITREGGMYYPAVVEKDRLKALEEQVEDLLEWQKNAIKKYPDLAISREMLAARQVAISYYEKIGDLQKAKEIRRGKHDNTPLIQVALLALSS